MPARYSAHDVELLLDAIWNMFTDSQARKLRIAAPWDDSDDPATLTVSEIAEILESWLE